MPPAAASSRFPLMRWVLGALVVPLAIFAWLMTSPGMNHAAQLPIQHFFIVTDISLLAAGVALLLARAALQIEQFRVLLSALGFMSMAGLFAVHAISTPGVLQPAPVGYSYGASYGGTVIGLSAYLSLFVPSLFFWASYTQAAPALERRFPRAATGVVVAVAIALVVYGAPRSSWPSR
jgi:uncharacterized membrane protein YidH (DUF202 family)